jgi:PAS domain S-box-containing protein
MSEGGIIQMKNKKNSEKDFLSFFDNIPDGVLMADVKAKKFYSGNKAICRMLGVSRGQLKKMRIENIHPRNALARATREFDLLAKKEISVSRDVPVKKKNGRIFYADINAIVPVTMAGKKMMIGFFRDVTFRKKAEEELSASKQHLTDLVNFLPDAIMAIDREGKVIAWNKEMEKISGVKRTKIIGKDNYDYALPFFGERRPDLINFVLKKDRAIEKKYPFIKKEKGKLVSEMFFPRLNGGKGAYLSLVAAPLYDNNGKIVGAIESVRDITKRKQNEELLRIRGEIINNLSEGVVVSRASDQKIVYVNPKMERMFGYKRGELINKNISVLDIPTGSNPPAMAREIQKALRESNYWHGDIHNIKKNGTKIWTTASISSFYHQQLGEAWIGVHTDITKHKQSEKRIAHLNKVLLTTRDINHLISREHDKKILLRKACEKLVSDRGYRLVWVGMTNEKDKLVRPAAWAGPGKAYLQGLKVTWDNSKFGNGPTGKAIRFRYQTTCSDILTDPSYGPWRAKAKKAGFASSAVAPIFFGPKNYGTINVYSDKKTFFDKEELSLLGELAGDIALGLQNIEDMAALRRDEEKIFESEQMLKTILDNIPQRVFWKNNKSIYLGGNITVARDAGVDKIGDLIGKSDYQLAWKKSAAIYRADDRKVFKNGAPKLNYEEPQIKPDGSTSWLRTSKIPLRDNAGKIFGLLGTYEDITDKKIAEEALLKSRERFKNLVDLLPQTIFEIDSLGNMVFVNHNGLKTFGYTQKDLKKGINVADVIAPQDRARAIKMVKYRVKTKIAGSGEYLGRRKDGHFFPIIIYSNFAVHENKVSGLRGIIVDLSDIKKTERALKEVAAKDEALLGSIADGVIAIDGQSKIILFNEAAQKLLGCTEKEALGKKWFDILIKEDENGDPIPYEKSEFAAALSKKSVFTAITPYFYSGKSSKNGRKFPVSRAISPVMIGDKVIGAINVFRDITAEKELDQAKSDFLSLASHQLRTPLSASKWILEMMMQEDGLNAKQLDYLKDLVTSNDRLIDLVNGLLDVTRIEAGKLVVEKKSTDIMELLQAAIKSIQPNLEKKQQKIIFSVSAKLKPAFVDPLLVSMAFNNILNNAYNFAPENGAIKIAVRSRKKDCVISIHNNGPVIPKYEQAKIFSKFYRGNNAQNFKHVGSGLGLFISKTVVEANGGRIWFESTPEKGTTFYVAIPK